MSQSHPTAAHLAFAVVLAEMKIVVVGLMQVVAVVSLAVVDMLLQLLRLLRWGVVHQAVVVFAVVAVGRRSGWLGCCHHLQI